MRWVYTAVLVLLSACASSAPLRVLFVGNSHTYVNDVPELVRRIAEKKNIRLEVASITAGGFKLGDHVASGRVKAALEAEPMDALVLQEQSGTQVLDVPAYTRDAVTLSNDARAKRVRVYLYMGFTRQDAVQQYNLTQADWTRATLTVADATGAAVAPVGESWVIAQRNRPSLQLQEDDGNHATLAGSYAAACTLFYALTGVSPRGASETMSEITLPPEDAAAIEDAALEANLALNAKYRQPLERR